MMLLLLGKLHRLSKSQVNVKGFGNDTYHLGATSMGYVQKVSARLMHTFNGTLRKIFFLRHFSTVSKGC